MARNKPEERSFPVNPLPAPFSPPPRIYRTNRTGSKGEIKPRARSRAWIFARSKRLATRISFAASSCLPRPLPPRLDRRRENRNPCQLPPSSCCPPPRLAYPPHLGYFSAAPTPPAFLAMKIRAEYSATARCEI